MGPTVWYFTYEDLSEDGIGPISGVMDQLFGSGQLSNVGPVGQVGHYFDQVCQRINVIAANALPGDVVFLILSGHGLGGDIHIGKPAAALNPPVVRQAFQAAQYRRYEEEGREPDPITVVLILNCCATDPNLYRNVVQGRELGSITENRVIVHNCNEQQLGYRWVRWASVRADDGMKVPMTKLLVPVLFDAFVEEQSFLKALASLSPEKMQREASKRQIKKYFMLKIEGTDQWDVDLASKYGQLHMPKQVRTIVTTDAKPSSCPPVTWSYQAIQNRTEQPISKCQRELEAAANNHGGTTVEQLAVENKALKEALERAKQPREDLSGSGRGGDRVKRAKVLRFPGCCEVCVNNGHGQCTRRLASPAMKMCKQHYEMFCKEQVKKWGNA